MHLSITESQHIWLWPSLWHQLPLCPSGLPAGNCLIYNQEKSWQQYSVCFSTPHLRTAQELQRQGRYQNGLRKGYSWFFKKKNLWVCHIFFGSWRSCHCFTLVWANGKNTDRWEKVMDFINRTFILRIYNHNIQNKLHVLGPSVYFLSPLYTFSWELRE